MSDKLLYYIKKYYAVIVSLTVFIIYMITLAPSVLHIDAGELAAVQATLGIAHPTGYPLFTIWGYLFLLIPLPFTKIISANILSSLWCALGLFFLIKSLTIIFSHIPSEVLEKSIQKRIKPEPTNSKNKIRNYIIPSVAAAITLAFTNTYWFQSTSVEVYSLQIFLFALLLFSVVYAFFSPNDNLGKWIWVGLAFALGFSNHMTTMLAIPFAGILFFSRERFNKKSLHKILVVTISSLPILILIYLYLPIRANSNPEINWGNPLNFENFWRHFTGKQYQVWLFSSIDSAKKQLGYFIQNLPAEFAYFPLIIAFIGAFYLHKRNKVILYAVLATFIFGTLYSINYDIVDIDSYFLLPYFMVAILCAFGYRQIMNSLSKKIANNFITGLIIIGLSIVPLIVNFSRANQSDKYIFEDYTKSVLNSVDSNSVIFTYQWDYLISPSYYFQFVENYRSDVVVIDKELLRRSWYYNQLVRNYPDVMKKIRTEMNNFLEAIKPFERDENYNPVVLERTYREVMTNLVKNNISNRSYYIGIELLQNEMQKGDFALPTGYSLVPDLLMFKVVQSNDYVPAQSPDFVLRFPKHRDKYSNFIENAVGSMMISRAYYELQFGYKERAKNYLNKIITDLRNVQIPQDLYQQVFQ